ncbi:hypothetical protein [Sphingomonas hengshuiensis]|uniref:hypothetical protein n=1 Tax=Sphingomonas hengshuiensis TaxID=1609977 RepID=UPI0012B818D1|nr:hypothetical protein [Sphingomonas hengshuiensis]
MVQIFVDTECGTVSDHFEFASVPRTDEIIFVQTEAGEIKLRVLLVEHYPTSKGDFPDPVSPITLQCAVI